MILPGTELGWKLTADGSLGYCRLRPFRTHVCVVKFAGEAAAGAEARHGR
jgi:hypothetical protein